MKGKVLVYGVTGYSGALVAEAAIAGGLPVVAAGRNGDKVRAFVAKRDLPWRSFALDNPEVLDAALEDARVVLNCAGPFGRTAPSLIEACIRTGVHYLDLAGEVPEHEAAYAHDEAARAAGVMIMPGVGFGVVPTDCAAKLAADRCPGATELQIGFATEGGVSRGTLESVLKDIHRTGVVRRGGELVPCRPAAHRRRVRWGDDMAVAVTNPWRADLVSAWHSTGIGNIETRSVFPTPVRMLMRYGGGLGWLLDAGMFQRWLGRQLAKLPAGPSDEELSRGRSHVWAEARGPEHGVRATVDGPDAYLVTADAATAVARRVLAGMHPPGFQTPAGAYGSALLGDLADLHVAVDGTEVDL